MRSSRFPGRNGLLAAAALIPLAYALHAAVFVDYVADDGGISLAYARNLASGEGLTLNPGGPPVEGYSNPLWVFLLSAAVSVGLDALGDQPLLKGLGLLFGLGTLVLLPALARQAYGPGESAWWFAPALLAVWTPFVFWAGGGLENGLYGFLLVLAALLQFHEINGGSRAPWSAVVLVAVAMTRPEGCAFFLAFLAHRVLVLERNAARPLRSLALWSALFVLLFGAFLLWRFHTFASWVPNTYYAKIWGRSLTELPSYLLDFSDAGWLYLRGFAAQAWPVIAVAVIGVTDPRFWKANLLFAGILSGQALYVIYVGGDWWHAWRFLTPVLPVLAVTAQHGAYRAASLLNRQALAKVFGAVVLLGVAAQSASTSHALRRLEQEDRLIGLRGRRAQGERIRALAEAAGIRQPTYLEPDIGGPALTGGLTIVDLGMLTDVHMARFKYFPPAFRQYIFEERRPQFVRTHSTWTRSSRLTQYPEFLEQYLAITSYRDDLGLHGEFVRKDLFVEPPDSRPARARFGDIELLTFEPRDRRVAAGARGAFTWRWRCATGCATDHELELILLGADGREESRRFLPVFGWYPTSQWQPGEVVRVEQSMNVPADLTPGSYSVLVRAVTTGEAPAAAHVAILDVLPRAAPAAPDGTAGSNGGSWTREEASDCKSACVEDLVARAREEADRRNHEAAFDALRQAVRLDPRNIRLVRWLEDLRERVLWIEYFGRTGRYPELLRMFDEEWAAGTLPEDRGRLEELYYALLSTGDDERAARVRRIAGLPEQKAPVTLHDGDGPVLALVDHRIELRELETTSRLHLFFKVIRQPSRNLDVLVSLDSAAGQPSVLDQTPVPGTSRWKPGALVAEEIFLWTPAGKYDVRIRLAPQDGSEGLCATPDRTRCEVPLGWHDLGR